MDFCSSLALHPPHADLVLNGEFDAFGAAQLRCRLDEAVRRGCCRFTVDASEVTFIDAGGLGLLVRLRNAVVPFGGTVEICAASSRVRRISRVAGLGTAFGLGRLPPAPAGDGRNGTAHRSGPGAHAQTA